MSKRKKINFRKVSKIFTAGLLLTALYSKPSFAVNDTFLTQTLTSNVFTSFIKVLSHFFPSFYGILEEIFFKYPDNQQLINFIGVGKESSGSFASSSFKGGCRNLQISLESLKSLLSAQNSSMLTQFSVTLPSVELSTQRISVSMLPDKKSVSVPSPLYSSEGKKIFSSLYERRNIEFIVKNLQEVKSDAVEQNKGERGRQAPLHSHISGFIKPQVSSSNMVKEREEIRQKIVKFLEDQEVKEAGNLDVDVSEVLLEEKDEKDGEELKSLLLESNGPESERSPLLPPMQVESEQAEAESILFEINSLSECLDRKTYLLPALKKNTPKKPASKHVRSRSIVPNPLVWEEIVDSLTDQNDALPLPNQERSGGPPPLPKMPSQQSKSDKLPQNHAKALEKSLQASGIKLSGKSVIFAALQKIVKEAQLGISEIPELIERLSQRIDDLIIKTYKTSPEAFEKHIVQLIQPRHPVMTDVDFNQGFERLAHAIHELWRANFLTDYIEKGSEVVLEKPLPTPNDLSPFINKIIEDRFTHEVDSELSSSIKQNASIAISSSVKNGSLFSIKGKFSTGDKKEILSQVFKLLVLDPSFKIPTLINARNNQDIDPDKLKEIIKPYIVLAIGQLYGSERTKDLNLEAEPENNSVPLKTSLSTEEILSAEGIVKKVEPWLISRLFELLPGNSEEEKIDFFIHIASQDEVLARIRAEIKNCSEEDKLIELKKQEAEEDKRTYSRIMETIMEELGSQDFNGSPLKSAIAFYRDVKFLIEDYLSTSSGFVSVIVRTEPTLKEVLQKAETSSEIYHLMEGIVFKNRYKIQMRIDRTRYIETAPLEVPEFVFLFSLPYWQMFKERLAKNKELDREQREKAQLKRKTLAEKLNDLFFGGKIQDPTKPLEELLKKKEKSFSTKQDQSTVSSPLKLVDHSPMVGSPPPPPPPPLPISQESRSINSVISNKDIQNALKNFGLTVKETSLILELLLRYKLQNKYAQTSDTVNKFYKKFIELFYRVLGVSDEAEAQEKFASQLGMKNSGHLVKKLAQNLNEKLRNYFLESLRAENIDSIITSGVQSPDSLKKFNAKSIEIITSFLKAHFQAALKQFKIETESAGKNFEALEIFLKEELAKQQEELSEPQLSYTSEEKLEVVLGTFARLLAEIEQNPEFDFTKKVSEKDNDQFTLDIEAFKPKWIEFLNEVITEKFKGTRPLIKIPEYYEEIKIEPSKVLPYLGNLFLTKAFDVLPGENQAVKISSLIGADSKKLSSLIDDILNPLLLTSYPYKTATNTETTIVFTEHMLKIFKEVIVERYTEFSTSLDRNCRSIIISSTDPLSLFSNLHKNQLGLKGDTPQKHKISMSSPHDKKKKIETEETISNFDIFLSLPGLWKRKQELKDRKQKETEEQQKKEHEMAHRVQILRSFINSEMEMLS